MMRWPLAFACLVSAATAQSPWDKLIPTPDAQAKLEADGFVVIDRPLKQGFSAYIDPQHPAFITSDSVLMAYYRVFEEYCAREDIAKLAALRRCLPELWRRLPAKLPAAKPEDAEGHRRARLLLATAWKLLSGEFPEGITEEEKATVKAEEELVLSGSGTHAPAWLGPGNPQDSYVNYQTFAPGSYGNGSALMGRYHRCRKWLQEMRLDTHDDATRSMAEYLFFAMTGMGALTADAFTGGPGDGGIFQGFQGITGESLLDPEHPEIWREVLGESFKRERFVRILPVDVPYGSDIARDLLRQDSPERTPEFLAAETGNAVALAQLPEPLRKQVKPTKEVTPVPPRILVALNLVDPRCPAVCRSEAWARKQLNTILGSWTEYRYAVQLSSREDTVFLGEGRSRPPGFVEPVPQFFNYLGELAEYLAEYSAGRAGLKTAAADILAIRLDLLAERLGEAAKLTPEKLKQQGVSSPGIDDARLSRLFPREGEARIFGWYLNKENDCQALAVLIDGFLKDYWKGEPSAVAKLLVESTSDPQDPGPKLWKLATTCYRLEKLSEKQLSGKAWDEEDSDFIRSFGVQLATLIFYDGNSYLSPRDDAPRIVRYATLAKPGKTVVYHAATARPRLLLIRYPGPDGKELLCQGSVYAYRDVQRPETPALNDWQAESEKAPWPEWMKPVVGSYEPPVEKKKEK